MKSALARPNRATPVDRLSAAEQLALTKAEGTIGRGLKAFIAVGLALTEIRDRRLYREKYRTFEEYCARRWDISRTRGYEISAAAQVAQQSSGMSTGVGSKLPSKARRILSWGYARPTNLFAAKLRALTCHTT